MPEDFDSTPQPTSPSTPPPPPPVSGHGMPYTAAPAYSYTPPAYIPPPQRSAWFYISIIGGSLVALALLFTGLVWFVMRSSEGSGSLNLNSKQIGVIDVDGVIMDADKLNGQIRKFGDDDSVKAIILHINSPGGGAAASQEVYQEVVRVRQEKHKKIIASIESVGASGAYYIASGCDRIYANDASVVGSIGVIMEWTNYGDLMKWAKLKSVVIHAGELKDAGDPTHDVTPQEQAYFQSLVDNMYSQFVHDVAAGRHTTGDKIKPLATGQVWTGQQALGLGLIDKRGGFRIALMDTAKEAGISGEPSIIRPYVAKKGLLAALSDTDDLIQNPTKLLDRSPGFYFMWK